MSECDDQGGLCAACGRGGEGLKKCAACKAVKYCSRECQASHRSAHKSECKRHKAKLLEEELWKEPPKPEGCPICFLRLSWDPRERQYMPCCGVAICSGCIIACGESLGGRDIHCPFCRNPAPNSQQLVELVRERAKSNDAEALVVLGEFYHGGYEDVVQPNKDRAMQLYLQAAELGSPMAHYIVGRHYLAGDGLEKDEKKHLHHMQVSAIGGNYMARHHLGLMEVPRLNMERAVKHWMMAASAGYDESLDKIRRCFANGITVSKEQFEEALRTHQKAADEMKSEQREKAAAMNPSAGSNPPLVLTVRNPMAGPLMTEWREGDVGAQMHS